MNCTTYANNAAGSAAAARVRQGLVQHAVVAGWQTSALPCGDSAFAMVITGNKRQPRRLGQRTT